MQFEQQTRDNRQLIIFPGVDGDLGVPAPWQTGWTPFLSLSMPLASSH
jgi:hypothetical protein